MTARTYARPLDAVDSMQSHVEGDGWLVLVRKTVRESDPYMRGHFPSLILYPAVFLLETVRQSVAQATESSWAGWLEIESVRQLRLARPMLAGDDLDLRIVVTPSDRALTARVRCESGGVLVADLTLELVRGGSDDA